MSEDDRNTVNGGQVPDFSPVLEQLRLSDDKEATEIQVTPTKVANVVDGSDQNAAKSEAAKGGRTPEEVVKQTKAASNVNTKAEEAADGERVADGEVHKEIDSLEDEDLDDKNFFTAAEETWQGILMATSIIEAKHDSLGGDDGFLGRQVMPVFETDGFGGSRGYRIHFEHGKIYYTPGTSARAIGSGAVYDRWIMSGGPMSFLGWPATDETPAPTDERIRFVNFAAFGVDTGAIYSRLQEQEEPVIIHGPIFRKWVAIGGPAAGIGYPLTNEVRTEDGWCRYMDFGTNAVKCASISWTQHQGDAHVVSGNIWAKWQSVGGYSSNFGLPVTDETAVGDEGGARYVDFAKFLSPGGSIYWTPKGGAKMIYGQIWLKWKCLGGHDGPLGYPVTDELETGDHKGRYNDFSKGGSIYFSWMTGAHVLLGGIPEKLSWTVLDLAIEGGAGIKGSFELELFPSGRTELRHELIGSRPKDCFVSLVLLIIDADNVGWNFGLTTRVRRCDLDRALSRERSDSVVTVPDVAKNWRVLTASHQFKYRAYVGLEEVDRALDSLVHVVKAVQPLVRVMSLGQGGGR